MAPIIKKKNEARHQVDEYSPHHFIRSRLRPSEAPSSGDQNPFESNASSWQGDAGLPGLDKLLDIQARLRFLLKEIQEFSGQGSGY